ncbi:maleylacetoacetate isomerase [Shewanella inventionis]|jgi:maleylpyruvate isomerase|uniref:Maleylacetoacetate isomerase n=1 Tax=Shewanella inventionis TaxID=1738770 RepID=A0ABQ1JUQ4_9GAMM|nr:maleylacetoacetate isomerase [Shewanella inventionis]MCL1159786.1 maleylacetoacetate isomerase [Shewanella inventionis]GGB75028.1 maleylacetoacetate isomerase [Shewanella inventionis]
MTTLYSFFNSSTSYRVRVALELANIKYEYHGVNIRIGEQSSATHIQLNPSKGVPILIDENIGSLTQSMAILAYINDHHANGSLLPSDSLSKARVLEFCNIIAADIHPVNNLRILKYLQKEFKLTEQDKKSWYNHWISEGFDAIETWLEKYGTSDFFCYGTTASLADCCLIPQVANALRMGCDLSKYSHAMAIYNHCIEQAAFKRAAPEKQPDYMA